MDIIGCNKLKPFFSIVLPVYNVEKYIDRCVNSVLSQNFDDYEIILVDDGSTDGSSLKCEEWREKDSRIRVIHKENDGLGMARNTGIENAKGEYIFFFDSDDYILPGLLKDVYDNIKATNSEAVFFGMKRIGSRGDVKFSQEPSPEKLLYDDSIEICNNVFPYFFCRNPYTGYTYNIRMSVCCCCLSIKMINDNNLRFVSERQYISEDIYFYIEMFCFLSKISFLCKGYYCYCENQGSLTFTYKYDRFERIKKFYLDAKKKAEDLGYGKGVKIGLQNNFIATTMGCIKMEAVNSKYAGIYKTYKRLKEICNDNLFLDVVKSYPSGQLNASWKMYLKLIKRKQILLLYIATIIKFYSKGI